jgi:hypothetical protein
MAPTANSEALIHQGKAHLPRVVMRLSYREFLHQKQADPKSDSGLPSRSRIPMEPAFQRLRLSRLTRHRAVSRRYHIIETAGGVSNWFAKFFQSAANGP